MEATTAATSAQTARPSPGEHAPEVWVAGLWRRALAGLADALIVLPAAIAAVWLASRLAGLGLPPLRDARLDTWLDLFLAGDPAVLGAAGLAVAVAAIYVLCFQILHARTLGMRLLGLRIIDVYGERPSALRSLARTAGYLAAAATGGLGFLWIGFDREKRGLHDWLAGTYVVKPPPAAKAPVR
jgi:uncharacterized RDD family membrane protein YckC